MKSIRDSVSHRLAAALLAAAAPAWAQNPQFSFDAGSQALLNGEVIADDFAGPNDTDALMQNGFVGGFQYSGGKADFGRGFSLNVGDGEFIGASSNPLVRIDGDQSSAVRVAFKAWTLEDSEFLNQQPHFGYGLAETSATLNLEITGLVVGTTYEVDYSWTRLLIANEEHEAGNEDPAMASGRFFLDVGGFGPGVIVDETADNLLAPHASFDGNSAQLSFIATAPTMPVTIDAHAISDSALGNPTRDDLSSTIFRGTLNLSIRGADDPRYPVIIISEVVDGDLAGGADPDEHPRFVELTNCGDVDVAFGAGDEVAIYFDGQTTAATIIPLNGLTIGVGQSLVIASELDDGQNEFFQTYGFDADIYTADTFGDGNDVYALHLGGRLIDTFGVIGVNPQTTVTDWNYLDSHATSKPLRAPNGGNFDADNWEIDAILSLSAPTDSQRRAKLQSLTSPGTHNCFFGPAFLPGDMNCDGVISVSDIGPFVLALTNPAAYAAQFPGCNIANGDINGDGIVSVSDIGPFVNLLVTP